MTRFANAIAGFIFLQCLDAAFAQVISSDNEVLQRAREQTIANQRAHAVAIAPIVWEQTRINNPGDPDAARRQYDAWAVSNAVVNVATGRAAETFAATRGTFDPRDDDLRQDVTCILRTESGTDSMRREGDEAVRRRMGDAGLFISANSNSQPPPGELELPADGDADLFLPQLNPGAVRNERYLKSADDEFAVILQNMPPPPEFNNDTLPEPIPPTLAEQFLDRLDLAWQLAAERLAAGTSVVDAAQGGSSAAVRRLRQTMPLLDTAADLNQRIVDHNDRFFEVPNPIPEGEFAFWEQQVLDYNDEANALNAEKADLMENLNTTLAK